MLRADPGVAVASCPLAENIVTSVCSPNPCIHVPCSHRPFPHRLCPNHACPTPPLLPPPLNPAPPGAAHPRRHVPRRRRGAAGGVGAARGAPSARGRARRRSSQRCVRVGWGCRVAGAGKSTGPRSCRQGACGYDDHKSDYRSVVHRYVYWAATSFTSEGVCS